MFNKRLKRLEGEILALRLELNIIKSNLDDRTMVTIFDRLTNYFTRKSVSEVLMWKLLPYLKLRLEYRDEDYIITPIKSKKK